MAWPSDSYCPRWPSRNERPTGTVALLERVLAGQPRLDGAACRGHPEWFDADSLEAAVTAAKALELCDQCPALAECRRFAASQPLGGLIGVVAGAWYLASGNGSQNGSEP